MGAVAIEEAPQPVCPLSRVGDPDPSAHADPRATVTRCDEDALAGHEVEPRRRLA